MAAERVWLRSGALHIIPLPSEELPNIPEKPSVVEAIGALSSSDTVASSKVQVWSCSSKLHPTVGTCGLLIFFDS